MKRLDLKGILIDFGDTLAHRREESETRYEEELLSVVKRYGYQKNLDNLASSLSSTYRNSTKGELKNFQEFWELLLESLEIPKKSALIEELEETRNHHLNTIFKLYEGAALVLSALRRKYKLALVSNCAIGTFDVIKALGLVSIFDCTILSYEVKVRKPNRRMYLEALQRLKLKPDECIFVADEISDLEGAREVGLKTLLVRQGSLTTHEAKDPNFKPDFQCDRISEIMRFL